MITRWNEWFLCRAAGLTWHFRVKSSLFWGIKPLTDKENSDDTHGSLPLEVFPAWQPGRKLRAYPQHVGRITYIICHGSTYGSQRIRLLLRKITLGCSAHLAQCDPDRQRLRGTNVPNQLYRQYIFSKKGVCPSQNTMFPEQEKKQTIPVSRTLQQRLYQCYEQRYRS